MRVTSLTLRDQRIADILSSEERLQTAQDQVSSGKRIQRPSDAPDAMAELLQTRSDVAALTQQKSSADAVLPGMQAGESALASITQALQQVRTLALQANNSTATPDERQASADQIEQLRSRILSAANTELDGRYLFAGTDTATPPFSAGPPVSYAGNNSPLQLGLADGSPFAVSIPGGALLNARGGTDLFQNLSTLESAIRSGDTTAVGAGLTGLDQDLSNAGRLQADLGARVQYVQLVQQQTQDNLTAAQGRQSQLEDVDMAQAILEEQTAATGQQATLAMAGRIDQTTLLDYLR